MESRAERRLGLIQAHLIPGADDSSLRISANPTAGEFFHGISSPFFFFFVCVYGRDDELIEHLTEKSQIVRSFIPAEFVLCLSIHPFSLLLINGTLLVSAVYFFCF